MMNQYDLIVNYLKRYGSITPMEAFEHLGITKLATRISEMKKRGYRFFTDTITKTRLDGKKISFCRYRLRGEDE